MRVVLRTVAFWWGGVCVVGKWSEAVDCRRLPAVEGSFPVMRKGVGIVSEDRRGCTAEGARATHAAQHITVVVI